MPDGSLRLDRFLCLHLLLAWLTLSVYLALPLSRHVKQCPFSLSVVQGDQHFLSGQQRHPLHFPPLVVQVVVMTLVGAQSLQL